MYSKPRTPRQLVSIFALSLAVTAAPGVSTKTATSRETLFFDAVFTHLRTTGPAANNVGHLQDASGLLRDGGGRPIGRFAFTCRWVERLPNNDAREECAGWGRTTDGRVRFAGEARANDQTHSWQLNGRSGAYLDASGRLTLTDYGDEESLVLAEIAPRRGITLRAGVVPRPAANRLFVVRANSACAAAATKIAKLPPFPFQNFDPLHPDPTLLSKVGRFFSGPGDTRPTLHALERRLAALGRPPQNGRAWTRMRRTLTEKIAVFDAQVRAAVAGDVSAWVRSTKSAYTLQRRLLIADDVFGTTKCAF